METIFTLLLDCLEDSLARNGFDIKNRDEAAGTILIHDKCADKDFEIKITESAG